MKLEVGKGLDEYLRRLGNLEHSAPEAMGKAIYEGAGIVYKKVRQNIEALPVDDSQHKQRVTGIRSIQKVGLLNSLGIAKAQTDHGYRNVKIGFDGYNKLISAQYPKGQPNAMIARTFESGNSFTQKHPFVAPAVRETKDVAEKKMAEVIDRETSKIMN